MHEDEGGSSNPVKLFGNIFISFVGAGILGMPSAFKEAGIMEGIFIMIFVGLVSVRAMLLLIDCKEELGRRPEVRKNFLVVNLDPGGKQEGETFLEEHKANGHPHHGDTQKINSTEAQLPKKEVDYGDIAYYATGHYGKLIVDVSIIVSQVGFSCAYIIFITNNMVSLFPNTRINYWTVSMLPPLILLCMFRHLHKLAIFSLFADFSNVLAYSVVFWFDFEHFHTVKSRMHPKEFSLEGFPFFMGIAFYCYEGAGLVCYLDASVSPGYRKKFRSLFIWVLCLVTLLYIVFGICGYLSFGDETQSIITLNLPPGPMPLIVKMCLCFSLFFTYPVAMFPVVSTIERRLKLDPVKDYWYGNMLRLVLILTSAAVVTVIPSFTTLMSLIGATCCTLLAFILPGIFHMRIFEGSISFWGRLFDYLLIVLGIIATFLGTNDALHRLMDDSKGVPL